MASEHIAASGIIALETTDLVVATFYKFVRLNDYREMRTPIYDFCFEIGLFGTILLAEEGINGTMSGSSEAIEALLELLHKDSRLADLEAKFSEHQDAPFKRLRVRLKKEIVTFGVDADPNVHAGTRVAPCDWNELVSREDVVLIDVRNDYEFDVGTFRGAIAAQTAEFGEFPSYIEKHLDRRRHKKVAMFCTGGIRCEKASAYMLSIGFEEVYQLDGGILKYIETVPREESMWEGDCFVFDYRVCVGHGLDATGHRMCEACQWAVPPGVSVCRNCGAEAKML